MKELTIEYLEKYYELKESSERTRGCELCYFYIPLKIQEETKSITCCKEYIPPSQYPHKTCKHSLEYYYVRKGIVILLEELQG
jgi:hypothetical protein